MRNGRILTVILAVIMVIYSSIPSMAFAQNDTDFVLMSGDANCDGEVNTADAVVILRQCVELSEMSFYGIIAGDLNGDNEINTADATGLLKNIVTDTDLFQPVEITGDISSPVFYTDLEYHKIAKQSTSMLALSEYTADAVQSPHSTVTYGQGYTFDLEAGTQYVFETQSSGGEDIDTVIYLIDNAGNVFLTDDDGGDGKYSRIEFYAWESNTYKLLVTGKDSNEVGLCRLSFGERIYVEASNSPSIKPTVTPTSTPTNTPTVTPTASPTVIPSSGISFLNETVPTDDAVVQYKASRSLKGTVNADKPIVSVRAEIINKAGKTEESAVRNIDAGLNLTRYALTDGGASSINGQLAFGSLSIGAKKIKLYCKTQGNSEKLIFTGSFYVGATDSLLNGNAFAGSASLSAGVRQGILDSLNAMDESSLTTKVIMEGFTDLGVPYGTGQGQLDCSSFVQKAYKAVGISLPRTSSEQGRYCYNLNGAISASNRKAGDLVFFESTTCNCGRYCEIHHVALYIGTIDGVKYFMEASSGKKKIVLRRAWGDGDTSGWDIVFYSRPY